MHLTGKGAAVTGGSHGEQAQALVSDVEGGINVTIASVACAICGSGMSSRRISPTPW
jgi:hypothetical protein